jgi:hypothetical protein
MSSNSPRQKDEFMKNDRIVKLLLGALVVALWALIIRPVFAPAHAGDGTLTAVPPTTASCEVAVAIGPDKVVYVVANGKLSKWTMRNVLKKQEEHDLNEKPVTN